MQLFKYLKAVLLGMAVVASMFIITTRGYVSEKCEGKYTTCIEKAKIEEVTILDRAKINESCSKLLDSVSPCMAVSCPTKHEMNHVTQVTEQYCDECSVTGECDVFWAYTSKIRLVYALEENEEKRLGGVQKIQKSTNHAGMPSTSGVVMPLVVLATACWVFL